MTQTHILGLSYYLQQSAKNQVTTLEKGLQPNHHHPLRPWFLETQTQISHVITMSSERVPIHQVYVLLSERQRDHGRSVRRLETEFHKRKRRTNEGPKGLIKGSL